MNFDPIILETLTREFSDLPQPVKAVIGKTVGSLAGLAGSQVGKGVWRKVAGSPEDRAIKRALTKAVASVIVDWKLKDAQGAARILRRSPFREELVEVIRNPREEIDRPRLEEAFRKRKIDLGVPGVTPEGFFREVAGRFLVRLRDDPEARGLYTVTRLDQIHSGHADLRDDIRELRTVVVEAVAAAELPKVNWLTHTFETLYSEARNHLSAGQLDEAERMLLRLLETIGSQQTRDAARASGEEAARRSAEQGLRLTYAQLMIKRGHRVRANDLLEEARALQPLEGKHKVRAGWVLLNMGRPREAKEILDPHDGTTEWRTLLAICHLEVDEYPAFRRLFPRDSEIPDPDILDALTRYHSQREAFLEAEHVAQTLLARDGDANDVWRGISAGTMLLQHFASSLAPQPINAESLIARLRHLHQKADDPSLNLSGPQRRAILWMRMVFYRLLLEVTQMEDAFHALAELAPADAASAGGWMPTSAGMAEQVARVAPKADTPIERALAEAAALAAQGQDAEAATRLARVRPLATGVDLDRVVAFELEARVDAGEDVEVVAQRLDEISDPVTREIVSASLAVSAQRQERGRSIAEEALARFPESLRLIRVAFAHTRDAAAAASQRGENARDLRLRAVELAERLVRRLPCPEHRIVLVKARALADDLEGAYEELRTVTASGYTTRVTAELSVDLARRKRFVREYALAAGEFYEAIDQSPEVGFTAAEAIALAGDPERAQRILRTLTDHQDRAVALRAYHALARLVHRDALDDPEAPEKAVQILLEGYERLEHPAELIAPLLQRGAGTRLSTKISKQLLEDFGSITSLPGFESLTEEQFVQRQWRRVQQNEVMDELVRVGAVPMQTYALRVGRELAFEWFRRRVSRAPLLVSPPLFFSDSSGDTPDGVTQLLLDRTALLTLAETGTVETVLDSDLELVIGRETFDWLVNEALSLREGVESARRAEAESLLEFIERHPKVVIAPPGAVDAMEELSAAVAADPAEGLTLFGHDQDISDEVELEGAAGDRRRDSNDLLAALVLARRVGLTDAARAAEVVPETFSSRLSATPADLMHPTMLGRSSLAAWHRAGLLEKLSEAVPQLVVGLETVLSLRKTVQDAVARDEAIRAVELLSTKIVDAVANRRISIFPPEQVNESLRRTTAMVSTSDGEPENETTVAAERAYELAATAGATLWSDDAAMHLYLDFGGVLLLNTVGLIQRNQVLRERYSAVRVVGTPTVLQWLVTRGRMSAVDRTRILADLARHGRLNLFEGAVMSDAALSVSSTETQVRVRGEEVLAALGAATTAFPEEAQVRITPAIIHALCDAIDSVWYEPALTLQERQAAVRALLRSFEPWISTSNTFGRFAASVFWSFLTARLIGRLGQEPGALVQCILEHGSKSSADYRFLLRTVGTMLNVALQAADELDGEARGLPVWLYQQVTNVIMQFRIEGDWLVPLEVIRLSAKAMGHNVSMRVNTRITTEEGPLRVTYTTDELEREAASLVDASIESGEGNESEIEAYRGLRVEFEAHVVGESGKRTPIRVDVDAVHVLDHASPAGRESLLKSLQAYYERTGAMESAAMVELRLPAVATADQEGSDEGIEALLRALLAIPRTWLQLDPIRFLELLRDSSYEHLRAMVGWPERWIRGESLIDRVQRLTSVKRPSEDWLAIIHSVWGPFMVAVRQMEEFTRLADREQFSADQLCGLLEKTSESTDPYVRIFRLGMVACALAMHPGSRTYSPGAGEPTLEQRVQQGFTEWIQAGVQGYDPLVKLHATFSKLVFAAVLDPSHIEAAVSYAGEQEDGDPLGDLLLLGVLLTQYAFHEILSLTEERGMETVANDLDLVSSQYPLAMSANPAGELFAPNLLGITEYRADPYLAAVLAILETDTLSGAGRSEDAVEPNEGMEGAPGAIPFWWSAELEVQLQALAAREPTPGSAYLHEMSAKYADRFGLLVANPAEFRAQRLLRQYERMPSAPELDDSTAQPQQD